MSEEFLANSTHLKEILKAISLFKNLHINALIIGESGVGKSFLANKMIDNALIFDAKKDKNLLEKTTNNKNIIIENFEYFTSKEFSFKDKKIVAISSSSVHSNIIDQYFGMVLKLLPLRERTEDIMPIAKLFLKRAKKDLMCKADIDLNVKNLDISLNFHSLKKSVYFEVFKHQLDEKNILDIMGNYLQTKLDDEDVYRKNLYLYEKPLITKGLQKYKSQLKLSSVLGLNRITLRKKIEALANV